MRNILLLFTFMVALFTGATAQSQYVLDSRHISKPDTVWIFTPSDYTANPTKQYPLIYLLHGWSGSYHQWNDIIDCQSYADHYGFIIVCPDALYDSWYINSPAIKESQYADFFFMDLIPFVAKNYQADDENIFITGFSMGGHGALFLFEQKPEIFKSAGSLSGVLDLSDSWNEYRISNYLGIDNKSDTKVLEAYSVTGNIEKIALSGKEIIFSCGTSDIFYAINNEFRIKCDEHKINATYISSPGSHNNAYWKSAIGFHFDFFVDKIKSQK